MDAMPWTCMKWGDFYAASSKHASSPSGDEVTLAFDGTQISGYDLSTSEKTILDTDFYGSELTVSAWLKVEVSSDAAAPQWLSSDAIHVLSAISSSPSIVLVSFNRARYLAAFSVSCLVS